MESSSQSVKEELTQKNAISGQGHSQVGNYCQVTLHVKKRYTLSSDLTGVDMGGLPHVNCISSGKVCQQ